MPGEFLQQFLRVTGKSRQGIISQLATMHNLNVEDAIELPLWRLLAASGATH